MWKTFGNISKIFEGMPTPAELQQAVWKLRESKASPLCLRWLVQFALMDPSGVTVWEKIAMLHLRVHKPCMFQTDRYIYIYTDVHAFSSERGT